MAKVESFTDLQVWQLGVELIGKIYTLTRKLLELAPEEKYVIVVQTRKAAHSVCANIAEGFGRYHYKDNINFLCNARGSLNEVKNFLIQISRLYSQIEDLCEEALRLCERVSVKLNNYIVSVRKASMDNKT